jgi:hypothetical protein
MEFKKQVSSIERRWLSYGRDQTYLSISSDSDGELMLIIDSESAAVDRKSGLR